MKNAMTYRKIVVSTIPVDVPYATTAMPLNLECVPNLALIVPRFTQMEAASVVF